MSLPTINNYPSMEAWAEALILALSATGLTFGSPQDTSQSSGQSVTAEQLPTLPDSLSPIWLNKDSAELFLGNNTYAPPAAEDLFQVDTAQLFDAAVVTNKIAIDAVTWAQLADAAVGTTIIQDAAIVEAKIASLAVTSAKIGDAAIVSAKIGDLAVTSAKINDLAVNSSKIANAAITSAKIANLAVGNAQLAGAISSSNWDATTKTGWQIDRFGNITGQSLVIYDSAGNVSFGAGQLGGRDLTATLSQLDSATANISSLFTTYGSTASAAQSALDALNYSNLSLTYSNNAAGSANLAGQSAGAASTSASAASADANAAGVSAAAADISRIAAQAANTAANQSASAAAASATLASASATTAGTAASVSQTNALAAQTAASNASNSATQASTSASNAAGSAATASSAATNAANSETASGNSAAAAASEASIASTKASEAATSASSAQTSATNAATSQTNASTAATQASNSETNSAGSAASAATSAANAANSATAAGNSATAASSSASLAATDATNAGISAVASEVSRLAAVATLGQSHPTGFANQGEFYEFTTNRTDISYVTVEGRTMLRFDPTPGTVPYGNFGFLKRSKGLRLIPGNTYRLRVRAQTIDLGTSNDQRLFLRMYAQPTEDTGFGSTTAELNQVVNENGQAGTGFKEWERDYICPDPAPNQFISAAFGGYTGNVVNPVAWEVDFVDLEDVTDLRASEASAGASVVNASNAAASEINAALSATASQSSATAASISEANAASGASTAASQASSATSASASAQSNASATATYRNEAQQARDDVNTGITAITADVSTLTAVVASNAGASAGYTVVASATGSAPAMIMLNAGIGGSKAGLVADTISLGNAVDGIVREVLRIENGTAVIEQSLLRRARVAPRADSEIFMDVELAPLIVLAADGEIIEYQGGAAFGVGEVAHPRIEPDLSQLPAVDGARYSWSVSSVTPTQAVAKLKSIASGTISSSSTGGSSNVSGTPNRVVNKTGADDAYDNNYEFEFTVVASVSTGSIEGVTAYTYTAEGNLYIDYGSGMEIAGTYFETWTTYGAAGSATRTIKRVVNANAAIGARSPAFGGHATVGSLTTISNIRYSAEASGTETAVTTKVPWKIYAPARS